MSHSPKTRSALHKNKDTEEEEKLLRQYVSSSRADTQATVSQRAFYFFCAVLVTSTPICAPNFADSCS
jgi:hypothetical protein